MSYVGLQPHRACQILAHDEVRSGYLVDGDLVLTARHEKRGGAGLRVGDEVTVRLFIDNASRPRKVEGCVVWADEEDEGLDLAVVRLAESLGNVVRVSYGRLAGPAECEAVGFPLFKHRQISPGRWYRDSHHVKGEMTPFSNMRSGTLELTVPPPEPNPHESPWAGISGSAAFASGRLVGVLCEHHPDEGLNHLAANSVARWYSLRDQRRLAHLCELLGLPPGPRQSASGRPRTSVTWAVQSTSAGYRDVHGAR